MTKVVLGNRKEVDKFIAFATKHMHMFTSIERFTACGRTTADPGKTSYEVGTVDQAGLMKFYVQEQIQGVAA